MLDLSSIDFSIIGLYFVLLIFIGWFVKKKATNVSDYFLAGRRLTLPIFVATLVSTWYGGTLGVVELSYNYGLVNWLTQGFFWYISYLFFALFLAGRIRKSNLFTIPDQLEKFYDKRSRFLGAIFNFLMVTPAPYILSLGIIFGLLFGWPTWVGIVLGTLVMLFYTLRGGFIGVVYTDVIQFVLMFVGIILIIPFAIAQFGGLGFLQANLPAAHFTLTGEWTTQMILVWGFIAFWTLVDPGFYQRCYAAKDSKIPKKGILISILFWLVFDACTTIIGMYARAAMPDLDPTMALPLFAAGVLPVALVGLFFTGLIASIMSTIDSFTLLGAMSISHDLYGKIFKQDATDEQIIKMTKWGILFTASFSLVIALFASSIISIWYTIGTVGISAMLVPVLFGFFYKKEKPASAGFYSIIFGAVTSIVWLVHGYINSFEGWPGYLFGLEPMYPGLLVSLLVFVGILIFNLQKNNQQSQ
jgi:solute:Na+ symporter, SSS family